MVQGFVMPSRDVRWNTRFLESMKGQTMEFKSKLCHLIAV